MGTRGVTLIELLVVISIIMILTVVVLPTMQPAAESRRMREAARAVNVFLGAARNRALATGHPCGVMFQREEADNRFCSVLYPVEVPPPYAGDFENSIIKITNRDVTNWKATVEFPEGDVPGDLIQVNAVLQLNYQGHRWQINAITDLGGSPQTWEWTFSSNTATEPPPATSGLPFRIFRAPVKTAADPLQLPAGVAIDLSVSGTKLSGSNINSQVMHGSDHRIVFSSDGSLHGCIEPIFLLLGQRERPFKPTSAAEDELPNWLVPTNLWVSVSPQTGLIATSENYYYDPTTVNWSGVDENDTDTWTNLHTPINTVRTYAKELQSMGGR